MSRCPLLLVAAALAAGCLPSRMVSPPARDAGARPGGAGGVGGEGGSGGGGGSHADGGHSPGHLADGRAPDSAGDPADDAAGGGGEDGGFPPPTAAAVAIAGQLHGAYLELECAGPEIELQYCVPKDRGIKELSLRFGGQFGLMYAVTLRVYGVVEGPTYRDGMKAGDNFYIGGRSGTPRTALWGLTVAAARTYHLNHFEIGAGDHYTYTVEYETPPLVIPGGASLVLFVRDPDNFVNTNHMDNAPMYPPPGLQRHLDRMKMQTLQTQFVYLEVGKVEPVSPARASGPR